MDNCLRLAVFDEAYRWHYHPASDELFVVVSGCLAIDLDDHRELRLLPWQCVTIPAMARHRTRALGRTVNLCFEVLGAGEGWAKSILYNSRARDEFAAYFERPATFTLGICNG